MPELYDHSETRRNNISAPALHDVSPALAPTPVPAAEPVAASSGPKKAPRKTAPKATTAAPAEGAKKKSLGITKAKVI